MRPIPRAMLTHTATLMRVQPDAYGAETLTPLATLTRVRVEPSATMTLTRDNTRVQLSALLLYDACHSQPREVTFALGQRVVFEGKPYRVITVEPMRDGRGIHHIEVGLLG